ncbi:MerR family transcriptional regulator [Sphingomonas sp. PL-96]|uniref:MerR family transcriptional regulator n=1 Tax=Sphingomonas sp. PL-96 TaxID=2887201 RepID=UPI001E5FAE90|nr:MerR family transcriptional regulator [Sphingomonas sp. PL-96]MCC2977636.1 MerR family transcriptional regulator [Sphingomonas sp. PL-96]
MPEKSATAFRTIGEVAAELGLPQHRLRYWESRFPDLRPVTRAGQRRYYRPEDVALVRRIHQLLSQQGYTVRGVQNLLATERGKPVVAAAENPLLRIRAMLADALAADGR